MASSFTHIIAFKYKPEATAEAIQEFEETFLGLETNCRKPDGTQYLTVRGGKQICTHPPAHGMQSVFIVEFANKEDEKYFHDHDQAHAAFIPKAQGISTDAVILDFCPFQQS
ncbi:hypothetical protein ASPZODRAFT_132231 [Penicilliopsis zonata CBS 506.65]|uniref:Stress-response A/B barrel domain-containing protein n=1 Tax=Penicilliopsis zonata CBS 506.65 TaxID=1073090 RepID=A0A1L9SJE9_9EURO|nr:hypothetical protein ASPZODRAFT_132231 [Penicilliopsis zonata CBS 506.65]OJJ47256.1 hypothetical protein ASPZODRAFT_132231 [Penicilliopsis zonata CBS 506.65]